MAIVYTTRVNTNKDTAATATLTCQLNNVAAGSFLVVGCCWTRNDRTITSVVDDIDGAYTAAVTRFHASANPSGLIYFLNGVTGGNPTVTITLSGTAKGTTCLAEFTGVDTSGGEDNTQSNEHTTPGATIDPTDITPVANDCLIISASCTAAITQIGSAGTLISDVVATQYLGLQYEILSGGASVAQNTEFSESTVNWVGLAATFEPTVAGGISIPKAMHHYKQMRQI